MEYQPDGACASRSASGRTPRRAATRSSSASSALRFFGHQFACLRTVAFCVRVFAQQLSCDCEQHEHIDTHYKCGRVQKVRV